MRRMLPQKLIDYIKELKNRIDNLDEDSISLSGSVHSVGGFYVNDTNMSFTDEGLILNDGHSFNEIGDGLLAESGALQLEAPIWKKLETSAVFNSDDSSYKIDLPANVGRNVIIKYGLNMSQTMAINIGSGNTSSALILSAFEAGSNAIAYINDCELNTPNGSHITFNDNISAGEEDFDVIVYYEDYYGPHITYEA